MDKLSFNDCIGVVKRVELSWYEKYTDSFWLGQNLCYPSYS